MTRLGLLSCMNYSVLVQQSTNLYIYIYIVFLVHMQLFSGFQNRFSKIGLQCEIQ